MQKQAGVALGAGLASALLFVVSAKGTAAAALVTNFTALPIMIAALAFGHISGLAGALIGAGAISVGFGPLLGVFFALCFALPGWWLAYLALLARAEGPPPTGAPPAEKPPSPLLWYPVGRLIAWAAAIATAAVLALGAVALIRYGGFETTTTILARRLDDEFRESGAAAPGAALLFIKIMPLLMSAALFLILSVNLWLAARIAKISNRLKRPWPDVPDGFRLPTPAAVLFLLAIGPALLGGAIGTAAGTIAAALALAFALQGLAAAHVLTRGFSGRRAILTLIYLVTAIVPVAVVALCLIGLVDCLFSLRNRRPPNPTPVT